MRFSKAPRNQAWVGPAALVTCVALILVGLPADQGRSQGREPGQPPGAEAAGLPRIGHSDTVVSFQALRYAPVPPPTTIKIINDYDAGVLQWELFANRSWLSASPPHAWANTTDVAIWIVNTDAPLGRHVGQLVIESANAVNSPDTIWVELDMLCPVQVLGDANWDGRVSQADIIYVVNNVLRGGPQPKPVWQAGDVNCDETLSQSDIIVLVNHLLKGGPPPCNVCQFF
jgi:hypothetical protein